MLARFLLTAAPFFVAVASAKASLRSLNISRSSGSASLSSGGHLTALAPSSPALRPTFFHRIQCFSLWMKVLMSSNVTRGANFFRLASTAASSLGIASACLCLNALSSLDWIAGGFLSGSSTLK